MRAVTIWAAGGRMCPDRRLRAPEVRRARCRAASPGSQAACRRRPAGPPPPRPKLRPGSYPAVPGTLRVPFPILRRARPQAAVQATLRSATPESATQPLRQTVLPSGLAIPTSGRAVRSASAPSRRGCSAIRRYGGGVCPNPARGPADFLRHRTGFGVIGRDGGRWGSSAGTQAPPGLGM